MDNRMGRQAAEPIGEVVDLFCGIGGISNGFKRAGFQIVAGYDVDETCRYAFETNNDARFINKDVGSLSAAEIKSRFSGGKPTVLVGCAPCQPFSTYKKGKIDDRWELLKNFASIATTVDADYVTMENVSGLTEYRSGKLFQEFLEILSDKYFCSVQVVDCSLYGVPQRRRRLVVIGSKISTIKLSAAPKGPAMSVKEAIAGLAPLKAGGIDPVDTLHRASKLSDLNLKRIRYSRPGGTWRDWPQGLVADCHMNAKGKGYVSVYGRMDWDKPAPTMTTQCYGFGNGRFGHPEQDRAISLREAAILQSFPPEYEFFEQGKFPGFKTVGKWIGNAVPVALAQAIAGKIAAEIVQGDCFTTI